MKLIKPTLSLLLAGILSLSVISCGQIENGDPVSEGTSSSQPESSQTGGDSSLPEEDNSAPESSQPDEGSSAPESPQTGESSAPADSAENSDSSGSSSYTLEQERGISDFTMISDILLDYVGVENSEAWAKDYYEQGKTRNIKTFVDYFQIDYDTFWKIFEDVAATLEENPLGYPSDQEYIYNYYTDEELNALFYGDEAAIREAFNLPADYPVF